MTIRHFSQAKTLGKTRPHMTLANTLSDYRLYLRAKGSDPKTSYINGYAIQKLITFLGDDLPIREISASDLRAFMAALMDGPTRYGRPPKMQAVHTVYCKLRTFFRWCEAEGHITENPLKRLPAPRLDKALLSALSAEELIRLDKALQGNDVASVRTRALVYTMLDSGVRLQECADLLVSDLDLDTGALLIRLGKGRKDRVTRVGAVSVRALSRYIRMMGLEPADSLWVGKRGPLTRNGIRAILDKLTEQTGIHLHAHKLRRTTALTMLRNGCDVYSLQNLLGHSDLDTLKKYLAQTQADISAAHQKFGVLDNLDATRQRTSRNVVKKKR